MRNLFLFTLLAILYSMPFTPSPALAESDHEEGPSFSLGGAVGVQNGYYRLGDQITDETTYAPEVFAGVDVGGGVHLGVHAESIQTSGETHEQEANFYASGHIGHVSLKGGYIWLDHTAHSVTTGEAYVTVGYMDDIFFNPSVTINRDLDKFPRTYINLQLTRDYDLGHDMALNVFGTLGYLSGDDERMPKVYVDPHASGHASSDSHGESTDTHADTETHSDTNTTDDTHSTGTSSHRATQLTSDDSHDAATAGSADPFQGLHRGKLGVSVSWRPHSLAGLSVSPFAQYIFPLSDDAKKEMESRSSDGSTSSNFIVGIKVGFAFGGSHH